MLHTFNPVAFLILPFVYRGANACRLVPTCTVRMCTKSCSGVIAIPCRRHAGSGHVLCVAPSDRIHASHSWCASICIIGTSFRMCAGGDRGAFGGPVESVAFRLFSACCRTIRSLNLRSNGGAVVPPPCGLRWARCSPAFPLRSTMVHPSSSSSSDCSSSVVATLSTGLGIGSASSRSVGGFPCCLVVC